MPYRLRLCGGLRADIDLFGTVSQKLNSNLPSIVAPDLDFNCAMIVTLVPEQVKGTQWHCGERLSRYWSLRVASPMPLEIVELLLPIQREAPRCYGLKNRVFPVLLGPANTMCSGKSKVTSSNRLKRRITTLLIMGLF